MGERLIDENPNIGKIVVVIQAAEEWGSIRTLLDDKLFVDWIGYVIPIVLPRSIGSATRLALVDAALEACRRESRVQLVLPSSWNDGREQLLPFAGWIRRKFDLELGADIDTETVGYKTVKKVVGKLLERLANSKS